VRALIAGLIVTATAATAADVHAQSSGAVGPPAVEAVAAITTSSEAPGDPFLFFDLAATLPVGSRFAAIVRPYAHRLAGGDWAAEMYQLQLRYQSATRIPVRIDGGIITSPLGLGTLELRPDLSPAIKAPFYYTSPLPRFESQNYGLQLMSGGYPLGVVVSSSGVKWDARAGVTDSTPARARNVFAGSRPPAMRQFVAGGGVTPVTGLRFGAGFAQGAYRRMDSSALQADPGTRTADATIFNLEAEYAFGHTRLSGEWVRNRFESTLGPAVTRGFFVQAVQAFGPRLFGTVRVVSVSTPVYTGVIRDRRQRSTAEVSAGYRLGNDLTVRGGYFLSRRYGAPDSSHMAIASLVWARRWF
jgi:hypothetical protein